LQANKKHSFHSWRKLSEGRRCQSPKRSGAEGRGSEHGAGLGYAPRRAAQAGLTGGADRSGRLRRETNFAKKDQPKAEPRREELASSGHFSAVTVLKNELMTVKGSSIHDTLRLAFRDASSSTTTLQRSFALAPSSYRSQLNRLKI